MTVLAFDFGTKKIGVAVGQNITYTATALKSLKVQQGNPNWKDLTNLLLEWQPKFIIVGLPLNLDGSKQKITYQAEKFAQNLYFKYKINVYLHDERLTTVEARSIIFKKNGFKALQKNTIHGTSAAVILESWFLTYK